MMAPRERDVRTIDDLAHSVQALPQELFELIYEYTFTPDSEEVAIDGRYKPPVQLQVDRRSRELFSKEYYSNSTFTVFVHKIHRSHIRSLKLEIFGDNVTPLWVQALPHQNRAFLYDILKGFGSFWLASLTKRHRNQISRIHIDQVSFSRLDRSQACASERAGILKRVTMRGFMLEGSSYMKYYVNYEEPEEIHANGKPAVKWTM